MPTDEVEVLVSLFRYGVSCRNLRGEPTRTDLKCFIVGTPACICGNSVLFHGDSIQVIKMTNNGYTNIITCLQQVVELTCC